MIDWKAIGLKMGIECHQQLDTEEKLFCHCPTFRSESLPLSFERQIRAVAGELGEVDEAAVEAQSRGLTYTYKYNPESSCLIEADCQPPEPLNRQALDIALQVCKLLGSRVVNEVQVMRKTVVDGSNTSGFQRTALVGLGGEIKTSEGVVRVTALQVEEDASTPLEKEADKVVWRLDRLGVPLIELSTHPDIKSPEHLHETALKIGQLLRATRKVKRGIGTIRQDLNISIAGGSRVEIKGAQDLKLFPEIARREVARQQALLALRDELKKRKASVGKPTDVTAEFKSTKCNFVRKAECVLALPLRGFAGLLGKELQPDRRVGSELSDYAKKAGVGGIIHSDEDMRKYQIEEMPAVYKKLGLSEKDGVVLVAAQKDRVAGAVDRVIMRAKLLFEGIPSEVRAALPEGSTSFSRPMPGAARLYPETDLAPVAVTKAMLDAIPLPERPEETEKRLRSMGLSEDLVRKMVSSQNLDVFDAIKTKSPALVATVLEETLVELRREGVDVDRVEDSHLVELFKLYDEGLFAKESVIDILRAISFNPHKPLSQVIEGLGLTRVGDAEVRKAIKAIVARNKRLLGEHNAFDKLMGEAMRELRGKADGKLIAKLVAEEMK
jgi:glutamyl-tRNA(Gln) amidotransferase subunit E